MPAIRLQAASGYQYFRWILRQVLWVVALIAVVPASHADDPASGEWPDAELRSAFLFAYPYYEFMWLRDQALYNETSPTATRLNAFRHQRHLAGPADRWANGPIRDTLYSTAWADLGRGPVILSLPDTGDRYYVVVLIGADTNSFAYLGRRSTGTRARKVAIIGPTWAGPVPTADQVVRAPTRDLYLNMRILVRDAADLPDVHALQDRFMLVPVGDGAADEPRIRASGGNDVGPMLEVINEAIARNPTPAEEAPLLARYRALGVCGSACTWNNLPPDLRSSWQKFVPPLRARLKTALDAGRRDRQRVNGWLPFRLPRSFAGNYAMRAGSAANSGGIFGLEAAEATYFMALTDTADEVLGQGRRYRLRLPAGGLPADAFWSVSLYEFQTDGQYMVPNAIDRYAIGDRTPGLAFNPDGSMDIWIQPAPPSGPERLANWLPSPVQAKFYLNARIYQPRPEVLDPMWAMPAIERFAPEHLNIEDAPCDFSHQCCRVCC